MDGFCEILFSLAITLPFNNYYLQSYGDYSGFNRK
nr:MAG TPA: hypothetical protein [Caudoviricetes sp.]DAU96310.1 MAG TPA: hypothetical protein [Caudoviricetes sp.]